MAGRADSHCVLSLAHRALRERIYYRRSRSRPGHDDRGFEDGRHSSFAAIWLVIVPLEAALSASRRVVADRVNHGAGRRRPADHVCDVYQWVPAPLRKTSARARLRRSASFLHRCMRPVSRSASNRRRAPASGCCMRRKIRYRLLARNMTDVITRHGANGAVLLSRHAAEPLFNVPVSDLLGHGLFDRVHVADRPAYPFRA